MFKKLFRRDLFYYLLSYLKNYFVEICLEGRPSSLEKISKKPTTYPLWYIMSKLVKYIRR